MAVRLNGKAYEHAMMLIAEGRFVYDEREEWSEHQPSAEYEDEFIRLYGIGEYARWYLGFDSEKSEVTKSAYEFPYGDFKKVHRCGLLSAESRAAQYQHQDIKDAVAHLHGMMEARPAVKRAG